MKKEEVMDKVEVRQKWIHTNRDLSGFGYVRQGHTEAGVQEWQSREDRKKYGDIYNPITNLITHLESDRKGGKYYEKKREYDLSELRSERHKIRSNHEHKWQAYKNIIAPGSQLHHQWRPGTSEYSGLALVEADQHQHGIIDVIQILEGGEINVFTEKELQRGQEQ